MLSKHIGFVFTAGVGWDSQPSRSWPVLAFQVLGVLTCKANAQHLQRLMSVS